LTSSLGGLVGVTSELGGVGATTGAPVLVLVASLLVVSAAKAAVLKKTLAPKAISIFLFIINSSVIIIKL
jgi:hypothetical protein